MDLLYQRYASPFDFLDTMFSIGEYDFIRKLLKKISEEKIEERDWECFVHWSQYFEGTYREFRDMIHGRSSYGMTDEQMDQTIAASNRILGNFVVKEVK